MAEEMRAGAGINSFYQFIYWFIAVFGLNDKEMARREIVKKNQSF